MAPLNSTPQNLLRNIYPIWTNLKKIHTYWLYADFSVCACTGLPGPPRGGDLMFQNVCNKILVTEPKHYYLVLGGFGAIQYNFPGGFYVRRVKAKIKKSPDQTLIKSNKETSKAGPY